MHISNKPKEETLIVKIGLMIQSGLVSYTHLNVKYFQRTSSLAGSHAELVMCHLKKKEVLTKYTFYAIFLVTDAVSF